MMIVNSKLGTKPALLQGGWSQMIKTGYKVLFTQGWLQYWYFNADPPSVAKALFGWIMEIPIQVYRRNRTGLPQKKPPKAFSGNRQIPLCSSHNVHMEITLVWTGPNGHFNLPGSKILWQPHTFHQPHWVIAATLSSANDWSKWDVWSTTTPWVTLFSHFI